MCGVRLVLLCFRRPRTSTVEPVEEEGSLLPSVCCPMHSSPPPLLPLSPESASSVSESDDDETEMNVTSLEEFHKTAGPLAAGGIPDALTKAKQSRGEKKARKVAQHTKFSARLLSSSTCNIIPLPTVCDDFFLNAGHDKIGSA